MRRRTLAGPVITMLAAHPARRFADQAAWNAHLASLGIAGLKVHPDPVMARHRGRPGRRRHRPWLAQEDGDRLQRGGQFHVGEHALCRVHAERLVHTLDTFTRAARKAKERVRALIWWLYAGLKAYRSAPDPRRKAEPKARFERSFKRRTGFATPDRLLDRLHANKAELPRADHPNFCPSYALAP